MAQIKLVNSLQLLVRRQLVWMLHFKYFTPIIVHCLVDPFALRYAEMKILLNGQHSNRIRNVFLFEFDFKHKIYLRDHISSLQLSSNVFFVRLRFEGLSFDYFPFSHISLSQKYIK